jgi:general secretion pathway protein K
MGNDQGMALLVTLLVIAILVVVTMEFARTMRHHYLVADNLGMGYRLDAIARSGVALGKLLLEKDGRDQNQSDSLLDRWAISDATDLSSLFSDGKLSLRIVDHAGRLQVNSLTLAGNTGEALRQTFLNLLTSGGFAVENESAARTIVDSVVDWIDTDDQELEMGAETGYYQSAGKVYGCRNGPLRSVEELLLVRGVTREVLYGTEGKQALADYLTVYGGDGKVNINTADLAVLAALNPLMTAAQAGELDEFRRDDGNKALLTDSNWYLQVPSWPGDVVFDQQLVTTRSSYFSIEAAGSDGNGLRRLKAMVRRDDQGAVHELMRRVE